MTLGITLKAPGFTNGSKLTIVGTVDSKPYLTGVLMLCKNPNGVNVLAELVDIQPGETTFTINEVLGGTANWTTGTYTIFCYWNPANGPGIPLEATLTFDYQG